MTSDDEAEESGPAQRNRANWMFNYLVEADSEHEITDDEPDEEGKLSGRHLENARMMLRPQLVPSAPAEDPDMYTEVKVCNRGENNLRQIDVCIVFFTVFI